MDPTFLFVYFRLVSLLQEERVDYVVRSRLLERVMTSSAQTDETNPPMSRVSLRFVALYLSSLVDAINLLNQHFLDFHLFNNDASPCTE